MIFSDSALAKAAKGGGDRKCPSCAVSCLFYGFDYAGPVGEEWEFLWCPSCRANPLRKKLPPRRPRRQLRLEV